MAVVGLGTDIAEIERVEKALSRSGEAFAQRILTDSEFEVFQQLKQKGRYLAKRFAAKEAVMKALGTGIRGVGWKEIEVQRQRGRGPTITLHGRAKLKAEAIMIEEIAISISHSRDSAVVSVVGRRDEISNN